MSSTNLNLHFDDLKKNTTLQWAQELDANDPLHGFADRFSIPTNDQNEPVLYCCGHSLGLMPNSVPDRMQTELNDWARLGVEGHFKENAPWYTFHEPLREPASQLVGANPDEVVIMNSLTVNLHLMMQTFYKPTADRHIILADRPIFPSDLYALQSQCRLNGFDPANSLQFVDPRPGEHCLHLEDIFEKINQLGTSLALILFSGVNFYTGQRMPIDEITEAGHQQQAIVGFDLAHAAGNVPLNLHQAGADFAVWCSYKYLNSGPGALAGCFVHRRHTQDTQMPRPAGWWGNDPNSRFNMHEENIFHPVPSADAWQLSNPPIFSMIPIIESLNLFDQATMEDLRFKSERLSEYTLWLLDELAHQQIEMITPREVENRGCQLSMRVLDQPKARLEQLKTRGVVADFRPPDVIRLALVPLYNSFADAWKLVQCLTEKL